MHIGVVEINRLVAHVRRASGSIVAPPLAGTVKEEQTQFR